MLIHSPSRVLINSSKVIANSNTAIITRLAKSISFSVTTSLHHQQHQLHIVTQTRSFANQHYAGSTFNFKNGHKNGETILKNFKDSSGTFVLTVSFDPKERLNTRQQSSLQQQPLVDEDGEVNGGGNLVHNYKRKLMTNTVFDSPTGEDNYVLGYEESKGTIIAGVFDGVGGWSEQGYDSSAISREISNELYNVYLASHTSKEETDAGNRPVTLLQEAFENVKHDRNVEVGSTTVCFGIIDTATKKLQCVNLGDSWFGVFRISKDSGKFENVYGSTEQTYYFNAPYQLSIIPDEFLKSAEKKGSKYLMNQPDECDSYEYQLRKGDVVMFTTDGLTDNVLIDDVCLYLDDNFGSVLEDDELELIGEINSNLVNNVKTVSLNSDFKSVFSQKLSEITGQDYIGGKPDDITSVLVYVG